MSQIKFLRDLSERVPAVKELEREHLDDFDEMLPTVVMGAITRLYCKACRRGWPEDAEVAVAISESMENGLASADESIRDLVMLGFVENLMGETTVPSIRGRLGPHVAQALNAIYPKNRDEH
jgi:hypothetical protein